MTTKHRISYYLVRVITFPLTFLPFKVIHYVGNVIGLICFHILTRFRKRTLSNLALAHALHLDKKKLIQIAKASFQNLAMTCLEYPKFGILKNTSTILHCENPDQAHSLIKEGTGIIFVSAHQANWETIFLDGTQHMPAVAIARPLKNPYLNRWINSIRERFGGQIITQKFAIREGIKVLKEGKCLGILGDQGMPESRYSSLFLGRRAWSSPIPALLAYKTKSPIIVATIKRFKGKFSIHYSEAIWPNSKSPLKEEINRLMHITLKHLEHAIFECPEQWLWQHNRWKQETPSHVYYRFRWDTILIILPEEQQSFMNLLPHLKVYREIYPLAFITFLCPKSYSNSLDFPDSEIITYTQEKELLIDDFRFKLIFNFSSSKLPIRPHFLKLSAFDVLDLVRLKRHARAHLKVEDDLSTIIKKALCRPNTLWQADAY